MRCMLEELEVVGLAEVAEVGAEEGGDGLEEEEEEAVGEGEEETGARHFEGAWMVMRL